MNPIVINLYKYTVSVVGAGGILSVKNGIFKSKDDNGTSAKELAVLRASEIYHGKEFSAIKNHPNFDIIIDESIEQITVNKYTLKNKQIY